MSVSLISSIRIRVAIEIINRIRIFDVPVSSKKNELILSSASLTIYTKIMYLMIYGSDAMAHMYMRWKLSLRAISFQTIR